MNMVWTYPLDRTSSLDESPSSSHADSCKDCGNQILAYCRGRTCCEYHSRFNHTPNSDCGRYNRCCPEFCISKRHSSDISKSESDASKRPGLQLQTLGKNPVRYCLRVIKSIEDNDLSFLRAYLTQYPSHVDGLLPFRSNRGYDDSNTHYSLLQIAVLKRNPEAVELILQHSPDLEKKPYPLLLACHQLHGVKFEWDSDSRHCLGDKLHDIIRCLLEAGANPNILYSKMSGKSLISTETPLTCCVKSTATPADYAARKLLSHGAKPIPDIGKDKESVKILQEICRAFMSDYDTSGSILPLVINGGLDVNAYYGDLQLIHIMCDSHFFKKKLRTLIDCGANINATNKSGNFTALHQILITRFESLSPEFIDELLELGADFFLECKVPENSAKFFPKPLCRTLKGKKTYRAMDLLSENLPRDESFYVIDKEEQVAVKPAADVTAEKVSVAKVSVANRNPSLMRKFISYFSGALRTTEPDFSAPGQQKSPTPEGASHASYQEGSDLTSHPRQCHPDAATPVVSGQNPPSYDSLFPVNDMSSLRSPQRGSFSWKRNSKKK